LIPSDRQRVGVGQRVGREDRLDQQVEGEVACEVLQVEQEDLVDQDGYHDEDETHVVVHGDSRGQEDDQGDDEDAEVELLDLEVVLVVSLAQDVVFDSLEDAEEGACHLEDELIEGAEQCVDDEHVEGGKEEVVVHDRKEHTDAKEATQSYRPGQDVFYPRELSGHVVPH